LSSDDKVAQGSLATTRCFTPAARSVTLLKWSLTLPFSSPHYSGAARHAFYAHKSVNKECSEPQPFRGCWLVRPCLSLLFYYSGACARKSRSVVACPGESPADLRALDKLFISRSGVMQCIYTLMPPTRIAAALTPAASAMSPFRERHGQSPCHTPSFSRGIAATLAVAADPKLAPTTVVGLKRSRPALPSLGSRTKPRSNSYPLPRPHTPHFPAAARLANFHQGIVESVSVILMELMIDYC
jgi:hypothetical protein